MKIKLKPLGPNQTELTLHSVCALFSYETVVALKTDNGFFRTSETHSRTTTKHINSWFREMGLDAKDADELDQSKLELALTEQSGPFSS